LTLAGGRNIDSAGSEASIKRWNLSLGAALAETNPITKQTIKLIKITKKYKIGF
jgi:hypothetical protein